MGGQLFSKPQFGKDYVYGNFNPNFQTTSIQFVTAMTPVQIQNASAGVYRIAWSYRSTNSKSNTNNETQVSFVPDGNSLAVVTNSVEGVVDILGGGLGEQFCGFFEFTILDTVLLEGILQLRRTDGNGAARINTMNLEMYKVD